MVDSRTAPAVGDRERRHAAQRIAAIGGAGRRRGRRTSSTKPAPKTSRSRCAACLYDLRQIARGGEPATCRKCQRFRVVDQLPEAPSSDEGRPNDGHVGMLLCAAAPCRSADPRRRVPRAPGPRRGRNGAACYSAARPSWSGSMRSGPRFTVWRGCCRAPRAAGSSPPPGRPQSGNGDRRVSDGCAGAV